MTRPDIEMRRKIKQQLINEYGDKLKNIDALREIEKNCIKKLEQCKIQLSLELTKEPSEIGVAVNEIETVLKSAECIKSRFTKLEEQVSEHLLDTKKSRIILEEHLDKYNKLECALYYMKVLQKIEFLSKELKKEALAKDDEQCATIFANMCDISRNLINSPAVNLKRHLKETLTYWHNFLKDKFSKEYEEILKAIKWPFINPNMVHPTPTTQQIKKLCLFAEYLLQIELPSESSEPVITSALLSDFPPLCLPIFFMIKPLRKRFLYHFYGPRQTNRIDKPEWYFTMILSWIRDHNVFVDKWIQPILAKLALHHIDAKTEFMRGLVQLAVEKLYSDLPTLQYDDFTFSHSVDEALGFDKELRETYFYPSTQPSVLAVLTQAQMFIKWMTMEKKYAIGKMDSMLSSVDAFEPIASDIDDLKVTNCADSFMTLLQTITERYESLPQPGHRLQFLELQLELLDDFRLRLVQLVHVETGNPVISRIPNIVNTMYYIETVLVDWGSTIHYLNLYYYKNQLENMTTNEQLIYKTEFDDSPDLDQETGTVFVDSLSLYRHMKKDLLCTLAESVFGETKSKSNPFIRDRWSSFPIQKDNRSLSLSESVCMLFEILATRLHQLQKSLANKLFTIVWRSIAKQLDDFIFDKLVLENRFNEGGAIQFKYDITRNLFPLFSQFTDKPHTYFTQLHESCILLNLAKGSALLLRETILALEGATGLEDKRGQMLNDVGVISFKPHTAVRILNLRTDISILGM